jgi:peptidyl-Asp metalloendopeptidase
LLWYHPSPNRFAYWLMDAASISSASPATSLAAGYMPIATGDFNADGYADMVWSNGQTLSMRLGLTGGGAYWQVVGNYPATWNIAGAADIDGDGKADLLWYNPSPNRFAYWRMDGARIASVSSITSLAAGYVPIATGDFNADGYADIVWSNGHSLSMRKGLAAGNANWQIVGNYPATWKSAGGADIDGDGKTDLLWHNPSPNRFAYWLMDGAVVSYASPASSLAAGYVPIATGDFNADGYEDMVWSNGQSMSMRLALAGLGASWRVVGNYPAGWKPAGFP